MSLTMCMCCCKVLLQPWQRSRDLWQPLCQRTFLQDDWTERDNRIDICMSMNSTFSLSSFSFTFTLRVVFSLHHVKKWFSFILFPLERKSIIGKNDTYTLQRVNDTTDRSIKCIQFYKNQIYLVFLVAKL